VRRPFDRNRFWTRRLDEMRRIIREKTTAASEQPYDDSRPTATSHGFGGTTEIETPTRLSSTLRGGLGFDRDESTRKNRNRPFTDSAVRWPRRSQTLSAAAADRSPADQVRPIKPQVPREGIAWRCPTGKFDPVDKVK